MRISSSHSLCWKALRSGTRRSQAVAFVLFLLASPASAWADPPRVEQVVLSGEGDDAEVRIQGDFDVPDYSVRARDGGRVLVVDVVGATLEAGGVRATGSSRLVSSSTATTHARGVRIELNLAEPARYHARASARRITLELSTSEDSTRASRRRDSDAAQAVLRDVHLERRDGRERLVVELSKPSAFRVVREEGGIARLEMRDAEVAANVPQRVSTPSGSVLSDIRIVQERGRAVVRVERRGEASATAIREGSRIVWLFAPRPSDAVPSRTIAREAGTVETEEVAAFLSDIPLQVRAARGRRRYSGRRVDLDFKDADIHNILRLLAEVGGVNIVTSDEVQGTVTIRMRNVPWDQALDVILQAKSLGMIRQGNLIRVAPLETLEKERESAIARQKQREQLAPLETRLVPVSYATADDLQPRVQELLSGRGSVSVDERTNVMIVRDIVENLDDVEELVRTLDTQTPQVLVEARIVEATSNYSRDVGIQWGGAVNASTATGNPTGLDFPANVSVAGGAYDPAGATNTAGLSPFTAQVNPANYAVNLPAIVGNDGGALGLSLGSINGAIEIGVRLSALESNNQIRIISSPRILTLDNHEAHIAQGTLIPYSQVSAQGVQTAFQEAKLELNVRPHVTADGAVAMHVKITRDEPDFNNTSSQGDPTILKREAETELLIDDGHTAVIGGIYTRNTGRVLQQVPLFGDIPILGALFQRRRVSDDRNELLIFLTPRIVNRAEALRR